MTEAGQAPEPSAEPYRLVFTAAAKRALAQHLPEKVAAAALEFIAGPLAAQPYRVGKRLLLPPHEGTWSARRGTYRILYEVDDDERTVRVTAVDHRADVYRSR
ncbi:type II toxin-antitoxin system RelE/ParE family toxin [Streptomyces sp. B1866]|uniref:type II toxin-antitoxin system RelE family toxin n=1 Tax=Streptomyces sp. B1866 TaxID=3075431 RepID=UPI00288E2118|nr:type II toxin-antitoxin system RelE/ParE family toxin [Streptomyces sp. B1866]MDT3399978.1 type II toxin-antitoxin system RelE/ParE family toxin [Streptomyces sp. B1866]